MIIKTPGIHKNVPIDDYHNSPGISSSGISLILDCPKRYWHEYLSGETVRESTKAIVIGQALHTLALEPDTFSDRFFVMPDTDRRTRAGKEEWENALRSLGTRTAISADEFMIADSMAASIRKHPMFRKLAGNGNIEDSILWKDEETGALLRSRPDYYNDFLIVDLKTTDDASPAAFARSIAAYGYHRQAAMACDALTSQTGFEYDSVVQFVVEKNPPWLVAVYLLSPESIDQGRLEYMRGAQIYQDCMEKNEWPGYEEVIKDIDLPKYAYRSFENDQ